MTHRRLTQQKRVHRIGDPYGQYPIFSGDGAKLIDGRWHQKGRTPIYAAEHLSLAMLEKLVHSNGIIPAHQHSIAITLPPGTSYEVVTAHQIPGWYEAHGGPARRFGSEWFDSVRTCILIVPSVVVRVENNVLINPNHPDFATITAGLEHPLNWDDRLFLP